MASAMPRTAAAPLVLGYLCCAFCLLPSVVTTTDRRVKRASGHDDALPDFSHLDVLGERVVDEHHDIHDYPGDNDYGNHGEVSLYDITNTDKDDYSSFSSYEPENEGYPQPSYHPQPMSYQPPPSYPQPASYPQPQPSYPQPQPSYYQPSYSPPSYPQPSYPQPPSYPPPPPPPSYYPEPSYEEPQPPTYHRPKKMKPKVIIVKKIIPLSTTTFLG